METLMADCVQNSLRLFMHRNAIFMCERLCAEFPSEKNLQLLATCYLQNGKAYCVYHILKGAQLAQSRYLFALACFQMNLLREAEAALCPSSEPNAEMPNGAAGHYLLGLIYRYTDRRTKAIEHLRQALAIDPLLWTAYEELCALGAAEEANAYFSEPAVQQIHMQYPSGSSAQRLHAARCDSTSSNMRPGVPDDVSPRQSKQLLSQNVREIPCHSHPTQSTNGSHSGTSAYHTPSPTINQLSGAIPPPPCRNLPNFNVAGADIPARSNINNAIQAPRRKFMDEGKLRKVSGRLFSDSIPRRSTRLSGDTVNTNSNITQTVVNGSTNSSSKLLGGFSSSTKMSTLTFRTRKTQTWAAESIEEEMPVGTSTSTSALSECRCFEQQRGNLLNGDVSIHNPRDHSSTLELLNLVRTLGEGYRLNCSYKCRDALEIYNKLSNKQYTTPWVLSQVGKAHFELAEYFEADQAFSLSRRVSPYSVEGMDIYSTVLYHLKDEMKLSYLAQELILVDRLSPQTWCAMGNCFSLQKDHETALKNFQRAVQLDSRFSYAHTLCGYEHVALDEFENGIKCYQSALQVDERHYNSWYGLGVVYLRQEKFAFAEHHFRRAMNINPCSTLMCYLGMSLNSLKRSDEALEMLNKAILAEKKNPLPMFQMANVLYNLERYDEALQMLHQLADNVPRESGIYALMGKIYKRLNMHEKAMFYFGLALDLKPPATDVSAIKLAMEKLIMPDETDEDEDAI